VNAKLTWDLDRAKKVTFFEKKVTKKTFGPAGCGISAPLIASSGGD
jgi:hypothetical protein